uniref:PDZ domain-containing protein n=1 Tax=Alexandrium monilatum TaxID=311494 RepID=A0A7S4WCU6_9DINO
MMPPQLTADLPPPEEGIRRFHFAADEAGPLGLRFSGGFPPLILAVNAESFAGRKGVPENYEVHAINGLALVPQNRDVVMSSLKARPVTLDVRPQGWKPKEKVKELERRRQMEEAEMNAKIQAEEQRREQVAREAAEQAEREAIERAARQELKRKEREEQAAKAREARMQQKALAEEFERQLAADPEPLRRAAAELMEAEYGSSVRVTDGRRGIPLRLFTRRKEVAWLWAGEAQELIGGGAFDPGDTWS